MRDRGVSAPDGAAAVQKGLALGVSLARAVVLAAVLPLAALTTACATLAPVDAPASQALPAVHAEGLGRIAAEATPTGSAFRALPSADFALDARLALIEHARHSIDLQSYVLHDDDTGRIVLRALADAAARGVRVRVLVDDLYSGDCTALLHGLQAHDRIEVRLFNPFAAGRGSIATRFAFSLHDFARVNHRMHNKLLIIDGAFAIAGGRNIGDEYFRRGKDSNFVDFDLLLAGAVVPELAGVYDRYWNSGRAYPLRSIEAQPTDSPSLRAAFEQHTRDSVAEPLAPDVRDPLGHTPLSAELRAGLPLRLLPGTVHALTDDPDKVGGLVPSERSVSAQFVSAVMQAQTRVTLASPYFIPGERGLAAMRAVRERGVQIELVTNTVAANDEPFAGAAYARYRKALLQMGVRIHEVGSGRLKAVHLFREALGSSTGRSHAKLTVIDGERVFVGSMNMDPRSARENTELGLLIDSAELAHQVQRLLDLLRGGATYELRLDAKGQCVLWIARDGDGETVRDTDPELRPETRLKLNLLSPFIPEGLL